jgi:transposase InsO family protein
MCHVLEVSKSGYYAWRSRDTSRREDENRRLVMRIQAIHEEHNGRYGSPRITHELRAQGYLCGKNRIARLMKISHIRARAKKKFVRSRNQVSTATYTGNRLEQQFAVSVPNRVWVTDLTCFRTKEGVLHLVAVLDLYSRAIVGWAADTRPSAKLTIQALQRAIWKRRPAAGLVVHSDRGSQFSSTEYQTYLKAWGCISSMNRQGCCYDNAVMESFFHTLKMEHIYWERFESRDVAMLRLFEYIELYYNSHRRHSYLGFKSPLEFETEASVS